jgi:hypothetical protein
MKKLSFYLKWSAVVVTIIGAIFTSMNSYPLGPIFLNLGSLLWLGVAIIWREWSLIVINAVLLSIYSVGLVAKFL